MASGVEKSGTIVVRPRGGLCNRMQVIAATHTIAAQLSKCAEIVWVVDWEMGARYDELFEPIEDMPLTTYRWMGAEREGSILERARASYYSVAQRRPIRWLNRQLRRLEFDLIIGNEDTKGRLAESKIAAIQRSKKALMVTNHEFIKPDIAYASLFTLQPKLKELVDVAVKDITDHTIGVHIRRGDHGRAIKQSPENAFRRVIEEEIKENPNATFFLATDSAETKKSFQKEFSDRILSNDVPLTRKSTSGLQGAIIDLYGLARTKKILGSQVSTFSSMAAKIGEIPLVRVSSEEVVST